MAEEATDEQQEPTMEEILASIRKIISDGDVEADDVADAVEAAPEPSIIDPDAEHDEVLELTEMVNEDGTVTDLSDIEDIESDDGEAVEVETEPENPDFEKEFVITDADATIPPGTSKMELLSDRPAVETAGSFASLAGAVSASQGVPIGNPNKTLEDLVKDVLRPMLREWLDDNLPPLVERLVEREINKLAGLNEKK